MELANKVALVTGAGAGIGRATVRLLAERGAAIAVVDRDAATAHDVSAEVEKGGVRSTAYIVDLAESASVATLVDRVVADFGRLDILVNNAGIMGSGPLLDISEADFDHAMAINLKAPFLLTQALGRHVKQREPGGKIVNILSSSLYRATFLSGPDYVVSKGGLLGLTRASAAYLAELDVNVNAVAPGLTDTPRLNTPRLGESNRPGTEHDALMQRLVEEGPLANSFKRVSTAEDVAAAIVFLCLPASRQVTGQVIHTSAGAVV